MLASCLRDHPGTTTSALLRACDAGDYRAVPVGTPDGERFVEDGTASIVWTEDGLDILSFAWRNDANLPALLDAWRNGEGP